MEHFFEYLNYRELLKDIIDTRRKKDSWYSYRWISQKIGVNSSGFLSLVINGKRNISTETAAKLCSVLNFTRKECEYFLTLVQFDQSSDAQEKTVSFEKLISLRPLSVKSISTDQQEYFNHWYNAAIKEMITIYEDEKNIEKKIAETIFPKINKSEIKESIELLERIGFIEKTENDCYKCKESLLTSSGMSVNPVVVKKYHSEMIDLASNALYNVVKDERDISSVTLSTDCSGFEMIKKRVEQCRQEIMSIAKQSKESDRVLQLNIQLFPLCKKEDR